MTPTVVRVGMDPSPHILLEFVVTNDETWGVVVDHDGRFAEVRLEHLQVEAPNADFPMGYGPFSRVESERG